MKKRSSAIIPTLIALAACEPTTLFDVEEEATLETMSGDTAVSTSGAINTDLINTSFGQQIDSFGNGYAYVVGYDPNDPVAAAYSGIAAATNVGTPPATGSFDMTGTYRLTQLDNIVLNAADRPTGNVTTLSRSITLTADFDGNTLSGLDGSLAVNGTINAGNLEGSVTYDGLQGDLRGQVGPSIAVGAFDGADADTVYAGGFYVDIP